MKALKRSFQIVNEFGLHARAAAAFVQTANRYQSKIHIEKDEKRADGKSILGVMMLAASKGSEIILIAEGSDALAALEALGALIEAKFNLDE